jgi:hypothetical protein
MNPCKKKKKKKSSAEFNRKTFYVTKRSPFSHTVFPVMKTECGCAKKFSDLTLVNGLEERRIRN